MRLGELMPGAPPGAREVEVSSLAYDNRAVTKGTLFFCVPGFTRDGHDFAPEAIARVEHEVERTTPEAIDLQRTFRRMLDSGDRACAMEVSSHALELRRADAIHFAAAIFTNLTQDHLDFHETMEDYFQAKRRLFAEAQPACAVINVDDAYGPRLAEELGRPVTFALDRDATYRATGVQTGLEGSRFTVDAPD